MALVYALPDSAAFCTAPLAVLMRLSLLIRQSPQSSEAVVGDVGNLVGLQMLILDERYNKLRHRSRYIESSDVQTHFDQLWPFILAKTRGQNPASSLTLIHAKMDPLSVTASLLAVLGAAGPATRALQHVTNLRHAPDQLVALVNEVSVCSIYENCMTETHLGVKVVDLQVVLKTASEVVESRIETSQDCGSLAHIVQRADESIGELDHLIHHELARNGAAQNPDNKPRSSRKGFLRHHRKLESLKVELREIKLNLLIAVGTLTL